MTVKKAVKLGSKIILVSLTEDCTLTTRRRGYGGNVITQTGSLVYYLTIMPSVKVYVMTAVVPAYRGKYLKDSN